MKHLASLTATVLATLMGVFLLWQFRLAAILFVLSLAVAAALRPLVDRQVARGLARGWAILLTYLVGLGALFLLLLLLVSEPFLLELQQLADGSARIYDRIWLQWPNSGDFRQTLIQWLPPPASLYEAVMGERGVAIARGLLGVTVSLVDILSQVVIVLVLSLYWALDQARFERLWLTVLPAEQRARARDTWRAIEAGVGAYIRSEATQSFLAAVLLGAGFWMMGLAYPTLLGLGTALIVLIPWLGAALAIVPVVLVALLAGPVATVLAVVYTVVVFLFLEYVVEPRLFNRRALNSLLIVLMVIAMGHAMGLVGLLAAPPLAAALQILFTRLAQQGAPAASTHVTEKLAELEGRLDEVRLALARPEAPGSPQARSLVERLESLIGQARLALDDGQLDTRPTQPS